MRKPYISITDFMRRPQPDAMLAAFRACGGEALGFLLGIGVMTSYKKLNNLPTKYAAAFPEIDDIWKIFSPDPLALNCLHYVDYEDVDVEVSLERVTAEGGPRLNALQLDMIWPDPSIVRAYKRRHPHVRVILQVGRKAFAAIGDDAEQLLQRLEAYRHAVDDVLLDKSGGKGHGLDAVLLRPFVEAVLNRGPGVRMAIAGGLGPDSLILAEPLIREYPRISIDAQSRLRPSGSSLDPVDWSMARRYLERAVAMFRNSVLPSP